MFGREHLADIEFQMALREEANDLNFMGVGPS